MRDGPAIDVNDRIKHIADESRAVPAAKRAEFLRDRCAGDEALRAQIESYLALEDSSSRGSMAQTVDPASADADRLAVTAAAPSTPRMPAQIGPYKLLEVIGEGGFGTVYVADQQSPVRRRIALKIIKPGMDSRAVIARFEQERQALAIMDHANIAKVLDAGTAPDGRPYFVMEYVAGEPITAYCDRNRFSIKQRLELFIPVCEAVQHAHHKGIIHRDIKPTNVLVSVSQGTPNVKVIDFGVAKAVSHVLTDKTVFTEHGQILGTPEYMSPEQAEMGALDIDTRTDVYSLGVLLYELLTGALPFEPRDLRSKGYNEIQRIIREVDPPRPSARLRTLGAVSNDVAQRRHMKVEELEGQLRRELEWIPLKAMRKDRRERYDSPLALADDIRNHLAGRPLVAGPESALYRARKFVSRNRRPVAAAATVLIALMIGAIVSTIGFVRAARNAELFRQASELAQQEAQRATQESARLRQQWIYNTSLLAQANPLAGEPKDITVRELLDGAARQLDNGAQEGQPRIEAALRTTLAQTYRSLSLWEAAERQWRKALELESAAAGPESPEAAFVLAGLGQIQLDTNRLKEAERTFNEALSIQREFLDRDNVQIADTLNNLGLLAYLNGDFDAAQARYREALSVYRKNSENAPGTADALSNLAVLLYRLGDRKQSMQLTTEALAIRRKIFGEKHIDVIDSLVKLAQMKEADDDIASAETIRRQALSLAQELLDENNRKTIASMSGLARTLWLKGGTSLEEAEKLQLRAIDLARGIDGNESLSVASSLELLANIARDRGDLQNAVQFARKAMTMRTALQPKDHVDAAISMSQLSDVLARAGQPQEAIELAQKALAIRSKAFPPGHWSLWSTTSILGGAYVASGQYSEAEPLLLEAFKGLHAGSNVGRRAQIDAAQRLVTLYEKWEKPQQAEQWKRQVADLTAPMASAVKP